VRDCRLDSRLGALKKTFLSTLLLSPGGGNETFLLPAIVAQSQKYTLMAYADKTDEKENRGGTELL
jgi:hypothetical protein